MNSDTSTLPVVPRNPCKTCSLCCRSYAVPVNGQDVWRIWRSQRLPPDKFVVPVEVAKDRPDALRLSADGGPILLILDTRAKEAHPGPCIFLLDLPGGHDRCGIYVDRPAACRAYPMVQTRDGIVVKPKALCPSESWTADDTRKESWSRVVREADVQHDIYSLVVANWNEHVGHYPERQFTLDEFYGYLFNVYERIAALDALVTPEDKRAVHTSWGHAAAGDDKRAAQPWHWYVEQILQIVGAFYPRVNPSVTAD
ncbi:MAG TPA: YkgJ family cysteine cluster protein [Chloroflexota bacterium]|nr:YkgJ family cysteine cluster protein [Chloroflexota bacterium]